MTFQSDKSDLIEKQTVGEFSEKAYLAYSMYVILDRALPHISDGLKPVQRRIVYAMSQLGLKHESRYKKSARTIGDVLGKFHPHGDTACYEAMVLMAQPFSYRYPLIEGQGNFGSTDDPKSFAAMRYTEAKLSRYAQTLLKEIADDTIPWGVNFDGTLKEPKMLPARLPNVLLNGTTGIAVGMSTDLPPHNINEVVEALLYLLDHPKATVAQINEKILAPDYPTGAEIITPKADILSLYETGQGMIKMRACFEHTREEIIINALPQGVSGAKMLAQIAKQMEDKKLPMLVDLRDESDHENPIRLVLVLRSSRTDAQAVIDHLLTCTDLEKNYRVNLNLIGLEGKPQVKNLKVILSEWLTFRKQIVKKRLANRLAEVEKRLHFLEGLFVVYLNLDAVIKIIRDEDEPKPALMKKFKLSSAQSEGILEIKLRQLAKIEEIKIKQEQADLKKEQAEIKQILQSDSRLKTLLKNEFKADLKQFSSPRRTQLVERAQAKPLVNVVKKSSDPMSVILSQKGWIRAGKGHEVEGKTLSYKTGDSFKLQVKTYSDQPLLLFDSAGRVFTLTTLGLPSIRGQGEPVRSRVQLTREATVAGLLTAKEAQYALLVSDQGYAFITPTQPLISKNRSGKAVVKIPEGRQLLPPCIFSQPIKHSVFLVTQDGRAAMICLNAIPERAKGVGKRIFQVKESKILFVEIVKPAQKVVVYSGKRKKIFQPADLKAFKTDLGKRGKKLPRGFQTVCDLKVID